MSNRSIGIIVLLIAGLILSNIAEKQPILAVIIIVLLVMGSLILYLIYRNRISEVRELQNQKKIYLQKRFEENKEKLLASEYYLLIQNYVKKYGSTDYSEEVTKLNELMSQKGFTFTDEEIERLIAVEAVEQDYRMFKKKIVLNDPKGLDDYIRNFIESEYGNDVLMYDFLKRLLEEQNIPYNLLTLTERITQIQKEIELKHFEGRLLDTNNPVMKMSDIDVMSGYEFESFLKQLFEKMGYQVKHTSLSGDQGADLIISKLGEDSVVQAKRYDQKISNKAIQEVVASIKCYKAHKGIVVSNNEFTNSARELASINGIELIDREGLNQLISTYL
jgi:HJR/Mrr/RecB family endonuclease